MDFGLNLYSIRTKIKTKEEFLDTAFRLKDMGYIFLQYSGGPYDHEIIHDVSKASDMPIVLTHVPMDRIVNDTDALMKEHDYFGCHNIGLGGMPAAFTADHDDELFRQIDQLDKAAAYMKKNGFNFFYHHHAAELRKLPSGLTIIEHMIKNTVNINFTVDTYWLQAGGVSVLEYAKKLNGRIECAHLKDYKMDKAGDGVANRISACGEGNINFHDVIPELIRSGAKYLLVEQDNAPDFEDPFAQVKFSIDYLKNNF